jgi:hypothetical protein
VSQYVVEMEIVPIKKADSYHIGVQCEIIDPKKLKKIREEDEQDYDSEDDFNDRFSNLMNNKGGGRSRSGSERRPSVTTGVAEVRRADTNKKPLVEESQIEARIMTKDEVKVVEKQSEFQEFLKTTSRYVERALGAEFDFRGDFFVDEEDEKTLEGKENKRKLLSKKFVMEENKDYNRSITSLDWSPSQPELFLASYSKLKTWSLDEPDGLINIYSIAMQTRPELTLNC